MTSVCVGGVASRRKTGVPDRIYLDPQFLSSILPPQLVWMRPFLPYIPPIFVDLVTYCSGEPPTQPNLVEATMSAVLAGGEFGAAVVAAELIQAAILNWYWYQICECTSGTAPTAPTPQSEPSGLVQINPPAFVSGPTGLACGTFTGQHAVHTAGGVDEFPIGIANTFNTGNQILPANVTRLDIVETQIGANTTQDSVSFITRIWNASGATIATLPSDIVGPPANGTNPRVRSLVVPAGAYNFSVAISPVTGSAPWTQQGKVDISVYCGGAQPGQAQTPCCPPDPNLAGMMTQILNYVQLIQRQSVPFGYIASTSHTALSGAGAISISGLLGVKVAVTTLPTSYGVAGSSPPEHFDLGFLTFGTADGFPTAVRLERNPQVIMPPRCSVYTDLDYDLSPGVVVTITELLREP